MTQQHPQNETYPQEPGVRDDNGNLVDGQKDDECQGHPHGPFDPMGETVYCDGSCRVFDRALGQERR